MRKFHIVIEVDVADEGLTDQVMHRSWENYTNYQELLKDPHMAKEVAVQRRLVDLIMKDPETLDTFLKISALTEIEMLPNAEEAISMNGLPDENELLRDLIKQLPESDRKHFADAEKRDLFSEGVELVQESFRVELKDIRIVEVK